jgi:CheY-like chemotaxis protein
MSADGGEAGSGGGSSDGLARQTILLVDDSDLIRSLISRGLLRAGYEVLEAGSGPHALEVLAAHARPVDMLITDMTLPLMDGIQLYLELRVRQPRLPVLFVSGSPVDDAPGDFLAKPFKIEELIERVQLALSFGAEERA